MPLPEDKYRIVLADDNVFFRRDLKKMIEERSDLEVVGEAGDGYELLELLQKIRPHLVILDISMPKINGIKAAREIRKTYPDVDILILTIHKDREYFDQAIAAGAGGYVLKDDLNTALFAAIESVREGRVYVPQSLSEKESNNFV